MPPRGLTVPPPKTESAREALKSFYCELCQKGYSRQNDFQAHESSYDHQHKKRLKDLKAMNRTMMDASVAGSKARKAEEKNSGLIKIAAFGNTGSAGSTGGGGFKKGGFKSAFRKLDDQADEKETDAAKDGDKDSTKASVATVADVDTNKPDSTANANSDSDFETDGEDMYDPRKPTGCPLDCKGRT